MVCAECRNKNHDACIEANKNKTPSSCDCQHRTYQKTIIQPATNQLLISPVTFGKQDGSN